MSTLIPLLAWCMAQVTLISLLAIALYVLLQRIAPRSASPVPATALGMVIVLTLCVFCPWPEWGSYGPNWNWDSIKGEVHSSVPTETSNVESPVAPAPEQPSPRVANEIPLVALTTEKPTVNSDQEQPAAPADPIKSTSEIIAENHSSAISSQPTVISEPPSPTDSVASTSWLWPAVIVAVLIGGIILGLLQLIGGLLAAASYRRTSQPIHDAELLELVDVICAELECVAAVEVRETSSLTTAATLGWLAPLVLLPKEWRKWTVAQRRAVLAHEIAHVTRHDFLACVLAQASLALHFYHPLIHWLVHRLRLEQELAADAQAALVAGGRQNYLHALAELALRQSERPLGWPARTFLPTRGTFMRRIEMLRDTKNLPPGRPAWPRYIAVAALLVGAIVVAGLRGTKTPVVLAAGAEESPPTSEEKPEKKRKGEEKTPKQTINLAHLPSEPLAFAAIRVDLLLKEKEIAEVAQKLDTRAADAKAAFPLSSIRQVSLAMCAGDGQGMMTELVIVETTEPVDFSQAFFLPAASGTKLEELVIEKGQPPQQDGNKLVYSRLSDTAAVYSRRDHLQEYLSLKRGELSITRGAAWRKMQNRQIVAAVDMMALRRLIGGEEIPQTFNLMGMMPLWDESETVALGVEVGKQLDIRLAIQCLGEKGAEEVRKTAEAGAIVVRNMMRESLRAQLKHSRDDLGGQGFAPVKLSQFLMDIADKGLSNVKVQQQETLIVAQTTLDWEGRGSALAALLPSLEAARAAGKRSQAANNLKQIMLGLHNYADVHDGSFPPAVIYGKDGKGKVPHSWRVELLPYLDQAALYEAYHFDEPWDSDANKKILAKMPAVFRNPGDDPTSTNSAYYVLVGKLIEGRRAVPAGGEAAPAGGGSAPAPGGTPAATPDDRSKPAPPRAENAVGGTPSGGFVVEGDLQTIFSSKQGVSFSEVHDGLSNTIAIVEAKRDIPWTNPEDIAYDPEKKLPELGGFFEGFFNVGIADGSVRFLSVKIDEKTLRALISPRGYEVIPNE